MIGSPPFANNLSRIHLNGLDSSELVSQLQNEEYHRGDAYGFTVEKVEDTLVSAYLLLTRPEVRQVFNEESQSVEEQEIQVIEKIPFRIDFKYGLLEIFADQDSISDVTNKIGQVSGWETSIENATFNPRDVFEEIQKEYNIELTSVKISDYSVSDSVVGDLSADVNDQDAGQRLIEEYTGNVSYVGVRVKTRGGKVTIGIYDSGSILVYNEVDNIIEVLDVIKESVVGGELSA
jgi:hypothetical protein